MRLSEPGTAILEAILMLVDVGMRRRSEASWLEEAGPKRSALERRIARG